MTIFDEYEEIIKEKLDSSYKTLKICQTSKNHCIEFANWIQTLGWYYGINGNYYLQSLGKEVLQLTPSQLFDLYKLETSK